MEKKNGCARAGFSTILWGVLAVLLCAAPCVWAVVYYDDGEEHDILEDVPDSLEISNGTTVNLYAYVTGSIFAHPNSILNIYSGGVGWHVNVSPDEPNAVVTVYGTGFAVDGTPYETPASVDIPYGTLTGKYGDGNDINLLFMSDVPIFLAAPGGGVTQVAIDIKPGSYPNSINLGSNGVIPVAILSDADFDATTVDPESVSLAELAGVAVRGKSDKYLAHEEDVNGDGLLDLVVKIDAENLEPGTLQNGSVVVTGTTFDDQDIEGSDEITIVPPAE